MDDVDFMSSKGWWVLIETQKSCKRYNRGEIVLSAVQERIRDSLDLVGMGSYFQTFEDLVGAVANF
jgi:anti-sigma B factor antagonist